MRRNRVHHELGARVAEEGEAGVAGRGPRRAKVWEAACLAPGALPQQLQAGGPIQRGWTCTLLLTLFTPQHLGKVHVAVA